MPAYRIYFMDEDGHIRNAEEWVFEADLEAIEIADELSEFAPMELWCGIRKVRRWDALPMRQATTPVVLLQGTTLPGARYLRRRGNLKSI